jgi:hypothetical protein
VRRPPLNDETTLERRIARSLPGIGRTIDVANGALWISKASSQEEHMEWFKKYTATAIREIAATRDPKGDEERRAAKVAAKRLARIAKSITGKRLKATATQKLLSDTAAALKRLIKTPRIDRRIKLCVLLAHELICDWGGEMPLLPSSAKDNPFVKLAEELYEIATGEPASARKAVQEFFRDTGGPPYTEAQRREWADYWRHRNTRDFNFNWGEPQNNN